jgi:S-formylglutathione hydrolase FrmB
MVDNHGVSILCVCCPYRAEELSTGERVRAWEVRDGTGLAGRVLASGTSMGAHKIALWNASSVSTVSSASPMISASSSMTLVVTETATGDDAAVRIKHFSAFKAAGC